MKNKLVADLLYQIADLLDIKGDIFFKTRAYRIAAQTIEVLNEDIEVISKEDRLKDINGVGEALSLKIKEFLDEGKLQYFEKLKREIPAGVLDLLNISGLGPKKVSILFNKLNILNVEQLKIACIEGKLRNLDGFGEITERNILRGISLKEKTSGRILLNIAYETCMEYIRYLKKYDNIDKISMAGSLRRMKETIGDIDLIVASDYPNDVMEYFIKYSKVKTILQKGKTKSSVLLKDNNIQVDLRVVEDKSYGAALQYFTGSKEHNVKIRGISIKEGYKLNEYGLYTKQNGTYTVGKTEKDIYEKLKLRYIEPEIRENRGEIEAAYLKKLPKLVKYDDIKGDFHIHSNWSDGNNTIEELALYSKKLGYKYIGIADHSESLKIANGLNSRKIGEKIEEISRLNSRLSDIEIFCGTECDIKKNGKLDYNKDVLKKFDYVGIAIHSSFRSSKNDITNRIISAMQNEYVDYLAHPTCRIIGIREPIDIDLEKIFETAVETNTYLEINSFPDRLDLNDLNIKHGKDIGVKFIIGTDSHNINHLNFMRYGIATARRGWLNKEDILNTYSIKKIKTIFKRDKRYG
ncbi:DNA polymerase/3'-5' exonuclease PolX [Thermoplasmatota archaeon]